MRPVQELREDIEMLIQLLFLCRRITESKVMSYSEKREAILMITDREKRLFNSLGYTIPSGGLRQIQDHLNEIHGKLVRLLVYVY